MYNIEYHFMLQQNEKFPCLCISILKFFMESFRLGKQNNYKRFCLEMTHKSELHNLATKPVNFKKLWNS